MIKSPHKHHIIPRYKCKELGIYPDFPQNIVVVDRLDHARIHWGYKCNDLEPLFEYVKPKQWIIDLIPIGDDRDVGAAVLVGKGEIGGIDTSGKNHPRWGKKSNFYKDGRCGEPGSIERKRYQQQFSDYGSRSQGKPKEKHGGKSYRQVYYKENKERLDKMMNRSAKEWACVKRIENLIILIENENKRFGHIDRETGMHVSHEVEMISDYIFKWNLDPEILLSYDLFNKY